MNKLWWVIIGLVVVIVLLLLFDKNPEPQDTTAWKEVVTELEGQLSDSTLRIQTLLNEKKELVAEHTQLKESSTHEISGLKSRMAKKRVEIDSIIIDNPVLIDYVNTADSVIEVQGTRIETLESQYQALSINMDAVTANFQQQLATHEQRFQAQVQLSEDYRKQARKERRRATLFKVTTVVAGVGMFLFGSQL